VVVDADLRALTEVWMGDARFAVATRGPRQLTLRIPDWFGQHPELASVGRAG